MTPIQQLMLGTGPVGKKSYTDEVFSTYLYTGNGGANQIVNGLDNTEEGMVWIKNRDSSTYPQMHDTIRGGTARIYPSHNTIAGTDSGEHINTFNNNGFTLQGASQGTNSSGNKFASWNFKSAPGFFDVVTYSGTSSATTIAHSLGSVPGFILVKCLTETYEWHCYHKGVGNNKILEFNNTGGASTSDFWNNTTPTDTHFSVGTNAGVNGNGQSYVAYIFAGGESTADTARSVEFDGSSDYLSLGPHSDLALGTGDFTIEFWMKMSTKQYTIFFDMRPSPATTQGLYPCIYYNANSSSLKYSTNSADQITGPDLVAGQWYHVALSRSGTSTKMFLNGTQVGSTYTDSHDYLNGDTTIGCRADTTTGDLDGYMSNVRVVKGTALYTTSFRPPTQPLTNVTNTKLLCCNNSSTTGSTVTPGTITATGTVTASIDSPFDDPAAFVFGESKDNATIKCGSYVGDGNNGSSQGTSNSQEVYLGWEPQWILIKRFSNAESWILYDAIRGITTSNGSAYFYDKKFETNMSDAEAGTLDHFELTSTGFTFTTNNNQVNASGEDYAYVAIRRADGYTGKPIETANNYFVPALGNGSSTIPSLPSAFPVDFCLYKDHSTTANWATTSRLTGGSYMPSNLDSAESGTNEHQWDSMVGCHAGTWLSSNDIGYLWKRHAGFDVVCYKGNGQAGRNIPHSLNQAPEMMWLKERNNVHNWFVYHTGANNPANDAAGWGPERYFFHLNHTNAVDSYTIWNNTVPTSNHFTVGSYSQVNGSSDYYVAYLFSSVAGFSKCGTYTGSANGTSLSVTTGFQPRFLITKRQDATGNWYVFDTTRGWGAGDDKNLYLNLDGAAGTHNYGEPTSTGFTFNTVNTGANTDGARYVYYAHA